MQKQRFFSILGILLVIAGLAACGGGQSTPVTQTADGQTLERPAPPSEYAKMKSPKPSDSDLAEGERIYQVNCASCHGEKGLGDGPASASLDPRPQPLAQNSSGLSDAYMFWRISEGGLMAPFNSAMPAWKSILKEDQIWQVISYIRMLGG